MNPITIKAINKAAKALSSFKSRYPGLDVHHRFTYYDASNEIYLELMATNYAEVLHTANVYLVQVPSSEASQLMDIIFDLNLKA